MEKIYHANNQKKAGMAILVSHKVDFRAKKIIKVREELIYDKRANPSKTN